MALKLQRRVGEATSSDGISHFVRIRFDATLMKRTPPPKREKSKFPSLPRNAKSSFDYVVIGLGFVGVIFAYRLALTKERGHYGTRRSDES